MIEPDVIVIGGGPTGVVTATLMAHRGLSVRLVERATEIYDLPRAIVMDDEIQRVLQGIGLTDRLAAVTTPLAGAEFVRPDGTQIMGVELSARDEWRHGHHPSVVYYQPELEALLRSAALEVGVDVRLGSEATDAETTDDGVRVLVDGVAQDAAWLVAADGASSPTRKHLGIPFVDQGFDQDWLVVDVALRRPVPTLPTFVQQICDPERPVTYVRGHAHFRRWEFQLQPGETHDEVLASGALWRLLEPWIGPDDAEIVRAVVYRFHATVAERMRLGRVLLAGDAAHQMPPFLGQGLCSGLRDGANLAWKLDLVHRGIAPDALLDTYGDERLPHAAGVVAHAVDTGRLIDQLAGRESHGVTLDAAYGGGRAFPHLEHGVLVGEGAAVGRQAPQPRIGGRLLDDIVGPHFGIVVDDVATAASVADTWGDLAVIVEVPAGTMGGTLPAGGAVVIRPDRYVAAVAADADELHAVSQRLLASITVG